MKKTTDSIDPNAPKSRLHRIGLYGFVSRWSELATQPWIGQLLDIEEAQRKRRSRLRDARIDSFKAIDKFDRTWPTDVDRRAIEELFSLTFIDDSENAILLGPNGVGKTMFMKNIARHALAQGHTVRFKTASNTLADLAAQDGPSALARRMGRWVAPTVLCIDEIGYLSHSSRSVDLLFEIVTRRYDARKPILITTNKPFSEWSEVFPHATCTVTPVDKLTHRAELIETHAESYRLKESKERREAKAKARKARPKAEQTQRD